MPVATFGSAVDGQLAAIKAGLVKECEQIATERERSLKSENDQLREEISALRVQLGLPKEAESPQKAASSNSSPAAAASNSTASGKALGRLEASAEIVTVAQIGGLSLSDDFWSRKAARPGHDHGFCQMDDDEEEQVAAENVASRYFFIVNPTGNLKLGWDVLGIPVLSWDLITIPMQVFGIEDTDVMVIMGWVTLIFWTLDVPFCFLTGFFEKKNGDLIMDPVLIAKNYMRGMFSLDMVIIGADWLSIILEAALGGGSAPGFLQNMALLRALRITRFARLMRLRKLKAKWQTIEDNIESEWVLVCEQLGYIIDVV
jgi:hypothetical protein